MVRPILFGAAYSVYVRAVRLALHEKGVAYDHVAVDVFGASGPPADYQVRHPFGRIPAFEHDDVRLYEIPPSNAISMRRSTGRRCSRPTCGRRRA